MPKIPLAWLQLTREKMRLLVALAGIGFADILMFVQLGFRDALFQSSVSLHENMQGDVFLVSSQSTALIAMKSFPQRRLYQALSFDGVKSVSPVYLGFGLWKNPENRRTRQLMVIGFNPAAEILNLPEVKNNRDKIKLPDVVLFDEASRPEFGAVGDWFKQGKTVETEVESRRVKVQGLFTLGASFGADGNLITSDLNFFRMFPRRQRGLIDIGVVNLEAGADVSQVIQNMKESFNLKKNDAKCQDLKNMDKDCTDVQILSHEEFIEFEKTYWQTSTSIGFIFGLGTLMGFVVGTVIVYQILYTDVADHLAEYATLKAIGYTDLYLLIVVFQEALILSVLGYIPGFSLASGLYIFIKGGTNLPIAMTVVRATVVLLLTIFMCLISGAIAVRKLRAADPADIF
ncbi:ABC transporter permease DevC [Trichocoleus sp. DQ-A3]|uniref:ABC transporter permease DevC n=1 Tax=Cyanophyceae TaxID=3028117 RepID=UPI0016882CF2|nr:ABC transporter permease DevC [Coleofasciculus sp. FACHB-125]MBD1900707.1 FtsX-like permease family protein [Coleofasciculus sp. FACHB-125]